MKHTPTPWKVVIDKNWYEDAIIVGANDSEIAFGNFGAFFSGDDAKRIVDCVNALEGIENPQQFVAVAKNYPEFEANLSSAFSEMDNQATQYRLKLAATEIERDELVCAGKDLFEAVGMNDYEWPWWLSDKLSALQKILSKYESD